MFRTPCRVRCLPAGWLQVLMSSAMCLSVTARWPQIILNFRNRGVGQMNIVTTLMYCFGNCVRLYTTATQVRAGATCVCAHGWWSDSTLHWAVHPLLLTLPPSHSLSLPSSPRLSPSPTRPSPNAPRASLRLWSQLGWDRLTMAGSTW